MAADDDRLTTDEKIERRVGRTIANWTTVLISLAVIALWFYRGGWYTIEPGEAAVVLRFGSYERTVADAGLHFQWPPPIELVSILELATIRVQSFGVGGSVDRDLGEVESGAEDVIQTADSNIVNMSYEVQYSVGDAYSFLYGMAQPDEMLRDATQASVRAVIGSRNVDEVLSSGRAKIMNDARQVLIETLQGYFLGIERESAFDVNALNLLNVQPPPEVRKAFDDVVAAQQDLSRSLSEARGDAQEIMERANADAVELRESALAYKQEKILESQGEAARFESLLVEYERAPQVTRERLYLETMEVVLPDVEKILIEPETASMMPFFPLSGAVGTMGPRAGAAPPTPELRVPTEAPTPSATPGEAPRVIPPSRSTTNPGGEE